MSYFEQQSVDSTPDLDVTRIIDQIASANLGFVILDWLGSSAIITVDFE